MLTTMIGDEIHESRLEIIDADRQAVVTVIEILSPTNKIVGLRGRASYEQKRKEVMTSSTHLVEIDLLREGDHLYCRELLPAADYYVHVSRRGDRPRGTVLLAMFDPCVAGRGWWRERGRAATVAELVIINEYLHWRVAWRHFAQLGGWLGCLRRDGRMLRRWIFGFFAANAKSEEEKQFQAD